VTLTERLQSQDPALLAKARRALLYSDSPCSAEEREREMVLLVEYNMLRYGLTPRQREIVHAIWRSSPGMCELAEMMGVSIETIKTQTTLMYERVGVTDRLNLILKLLGKGRT
jgi:DNA-binding CsgD family transcriptional regulator